jgi:ferredoxin
MKTLICNCNRTMPLDGPGLAKALGPEAADGLQTVHTSLCRREAGAFQRAAKAGDDLLVACTQESALNAETDGAPGLAERPIRFVNLRETGGWSRDAAAATPKLAALIAAAQHPEPEPVPTVSYRSQGRVLVVGEADAAVRAASLLADALEVSLLLTSPRGTLPQARTMTVHAGRVLRISGWLGAFEVSWLADNPIDADLCTRCNACIAACPEGAIDFSYQVDLSRCGAHRECVRVCEAVGAIDFGRSAVELTESFDLVLDLGTTALIALHQPPQGYFHARDDAALTRAVVELRGAVGEFEKPKFFQYRQKVCAHSRNQQVGCHACIDVCSAQAIRSDASLKGKASGGGGIVVEPHLCVGCGACTTVCPSGALSYATPRPDEMGARLRAMLSTHARAGGRDAALLLHSRGAGAALIGALGRLACTDASVQGVPARVLPVELWHTASVGIDLWLAALAHGASQVLVLVTDEEAPDYRRALAEQMSVAQALLTGLGHAGRHLHLIAPADARELDAALRLPPAPSMGPPGAFAVQADKRATLELAISHLVRSVAPLPDAVALPAAGSPFGTVHVDGARCTLCLSCVGACPEGALLDNPDRPQLRFIEANCVQCGLCATTCPEAAITLEPRLLLADGGKARREKRVLHEAEPFRCVRCGKPFGTVAAIEAMVGKLAGHAMFQGAAAQRLKMCADCRVIDLHRDPGEVRITDL